MELKIYCIPEKLVLKSLKCFTLLFLHLIFVLHSLSSVILNSKLTNNSYFCSFRICFFSVALVKRVFILYWLLITKSTKSKIHAISILVGSWNIICLHLYVNANIPESRKLMSYYWWSRSYDYKRNKIYLQEVHLLCTCKLCAWREWQNDITWNKQNLGKKAGRKIEGYKVNLFCLHFWSGNHVIRKSVYYLWSGNHEIIVFGPPIVLI